MKMIRPVTINDAVLTSSNVTEADHPTWVVGTTYAVDEYVIYDHVVYQSVQGSNSLMDMVARQRLTLIPLI